MGDYNIDNAPLVNPYKVLACLLNTSYINFITIINLIGSMVHKADKAR